MANTFGIFIGFLLIVFVIFLIFFIIYFVIDNPSSECRSKNIPTPTNFTYNIEHNGSKTLYTLKWTPALNVDGYVIYQGSEYDFKPNNDNIITTINDAKTDNYVGNVSFGGTYYFYISSFVIKNSSTCYSDPYPSTALSVPVTSSPIGLGLFIAPTSYCSYYKKELSMATTTRTCPYGDGNEIGFEYSDKLGNDNQFIFTSAGTIMPAKDTSKCIYFNPNSSNNIPCYSSCNSIPDNYKIWNLEKTSNGHYIKLANNSVYLAGYRGPFETDMHGPFGYTSKPSENLTCSEDVFPLWIQI